jgi:hypothetical protein
MEKEVRKNRELQLKDVEETLKREFERAEELKVMNLKNNFYTEQSLNLSISLGETYSKSPLC